MTFLIGVGGVLVFMLIFGYFFLRDEIKEWREEMASKQ